jgi:hypothetical protein
VLHSRTTSPNFKSRKVTSWEMRVVSWSGAARELPWMSRSMR